MRVAIISSVRSLNYGGCLQAYALGQAIKACGKDDIDFEYLDYQRNYYKDAFVWFIRKILYGILHKDDAPSWTMKEFVQTVIARKKNDFSETTEKFKEFWELTPCTAPLWRNDIEKLEDAYDLFIMGSDQNWNCGKLNLDKTLLLDFVRDNQKKGSYAPSIGMKAIPVKYEKTYKENWNKFKYLSCREKSGVELIQKMTGHNAKCVIDPSLLLNREQWECVAEISASDENGYVLVYMLEESETLLKFATEIAKQKNIDIKFIYGDIGKNDGIGPKQWLGLFLNARYVVTNSFHGTAFSINFQKDFYVETKEKNVYEDSSDRIVELLEVLNLQSRLLVEGNMLKDIDEIEYTFANQKLRELREESMDYLQKMLNKK